MSLSIAALLSTAALYLIFVHPAESRPLLLADVRRYPGAAKLAPGLFAGAAISAANYVYGQMLERFDIKSQEVLGEHLVDAVINPSLVGVLLLLSVCVVAPLVEELVFRGSMFEFFSKTKRMPPVQVVLLTSAIFAGVHFELAVMPATFVVGIALGVLRLQTRSLQPCILAHAIANSAAVAIAVAMAH